MTLDAELTVLFGRSVLEQSKLPLEVDAERVAEAARQLREAEGEPVKQRAIVKDLDADTALALCKWLREPDMGRRLQEEARRDF